MYAVHNYLSKEIFCNPGLDGISEVINEVRDLANEWDYIAINLGIRPDDIEKIRRNRIGRDKRALIDAEKIRRNWNDAERPLSDAERPLSDAIYYWIKMDYMPSFRIPNWRTLAITVRHINYGIARTIARNHPQGN